MSAMTSFPQKCTAFAGVERIASGEVSEVAVDARRDSDGMRVMFSFGVPTPAALFRRADTVWLVFDSTRPVDVEPIRAKAGAIIGDVSRLKVGEWVMFVASDGVAMFINEVPCRLFDDSRILMRVEDPEAYF